MKFWEAMRFVDQGEKVRRAGWAVWREYISKEPPLTDLAENGYQFEIMLTTCRPAYTVVSPFSPNEGDMVSTDWEIYGSNVVI